jgi:hypothetical protein
MCLFTHIAAGALAGSVAPNPWVAPLFGLGSHFLLDILPHYDFESMKMEIFFALAAFAVLIAGGATSSMILLGAIFAIVPDFENLLWRIGKIRNEQKIFPGHNWLVAHGRLAGRMNLACQFILSAAALAYLVRGIA